MKLCAWRYVLRWERAGYWITAVLTTAYLIVAIYAGSAGS